MTGRAAPDLVLRAATGADAALLAALHAPSFPDEPWSAPTLDMFLESRGVFALIAEDIAEEPAAAVPHGFILCRTAADEAEVLTLAVLPAHRRRGTAARLLAAALECLAAGGITTLFLEVAEDNPAALALYRTAGFAPVGRRPDYYDRGTAPVAALVLARPVQSLATIRTCTPQAPAAVSGARDTTR